MNKNDQEFLVQKIRTQYTEKENTALDELKALDAKVKRPANVFAYIFGSLGAVVMGFGMSLAMTDIGSALGLQGGLPMLVGIPVGLAGILLVSVAYPAYNRILQNERKKIAPQILQLAEELMK